MHKYMPTKLWNYPDEFGNNIKYPVDFHLMKENFKVYVSYWILQLSLFHGFAGMNSHKHSTHKKTEESYEVLNLKGTLMHI